MSESLPHRRLSSRRQLPWGWIATGAFVLLLAAFMLPKIIGAREAARRSSCNCRLKQIMLALHNYHDKYGTFPPAYVADVHGRPMHSWRVLLLPFLEQKPLYDRYRFNEPWDGPHNRKLHDEVVDIYRCPTDVGGWNTDTSYVVVVGRRTLFPWDRGVARSDVKDGTTNTVAVVECHNSGIHWMEPRDLEFSKIPKRINAGHGLGINSGHPGGAQVGLADGSARFLSDRLPEATVRKLLQIDDGFPEGNW